MSSKNFNAYAAYYDLLYREKNYRGEAAFIDEIVREHRPSAEKIIDLGCGTGVHDWFLAERGYSVTGVDQSSAMLEIARGRKDQFLDVTTAPLFLQADITEFSLMERFDVAISLFDVVSYLPDYDALRALLRNIRRCLKPGGLFVFDCWYGPAVYTQQPTLRVRELEDDTIKLTRIARPLVHHAQNRVDVNYEVFVECKADGRIETFSERHPMRCYFDDELGLVFSEFGFKRLFAATWFTKAAPSTDTWSVLFGFEHA